MIDEALLETLQGGAWCSGAEIGTRIGVSRTAVWKKIEALRERGYSIEAMAGRGYRLLGGPDRLLPTEVRRHLTAKRLGMDIVHREEVDSTNRLAGELARGGAPEGTVVVAEAQTAGRGRLGREWTSPSNLNLYLSVVLRPPVAPVDVTSLSLVAAIAVAEAILSTTDLRSGIKWPNDVLLGQRKVCGILTEMDAESDRVRFLVLGIGVNLNATARDFPPELRRKASSLRIATRRRIDRAAFTGALLNELEVVYDQFVAGGFPAVQKAYEAYHCLPGRRVRVEGAGNPRGVVRGVAPDGALLVETADGVVRVSSGEVTLRGTYRS
ncbi:MAG: biotin--[acetyl-CoA-carboxylase] ligase [Candidatus Binatia bacterium]|nr:biotin--[acetyl-CoA-carboxylase] ligase [Candidatus Binatia bacterium]